MTLVDTHCHLYDDALLPRAEALLAAARARGVHAFVVPAVDEATWEVTARLAERHPELLPALGVHPWCAEEVDDRQLGRLEEACRACGAVAVGEIGLDHECEAPWADQERAFRGQLEVAASLGLPVLVHVRKAFAAALTAWRAAPAGIPGGLLHAYGGSADFAREAVRAGLCVSYAGTVTWPGARRIQDAAATIPEGALLVETDAPYIAVHPHTKPCLPEHLPETVARLAALRGRTPEALAAVTTENAVRLFGVRLATVLARVTPDSPPARGPSAVRRAQVPGSKPNRPEA